MAILNSQELENVGFKSFGANVYISDKASIYNAQNIEIGNNVRIDDFCILSAGAGGISLGNYIHIAAYSSLIGAGRIKLQDFCNISSRVSIYSSSDDYSGDTMTNPMVPDSLKAVQHAPVTIGEHVIVGCGSVILPGVTLNTGVAIGALSLVNKDCSEFSIYAGTPIRHVKDRSYNLLCLAKNIKQKAD
jgi:galactoside O-acetyltransferase